MGLMRLMLIFKCADLKSKSVASLMMPSRNINNAEVTSVFLFCVVSHFEIISNKLGKTRPSFMTVSCRVSEEKSLMAHAQKEMDRKPSRRR